MDAHVNGFFDEGNSWEGAAEETEEEEEREESVFGWQIWYLVAGVMCGVVANILGRFWGAGTAGGPAAAAAASAAKDFNFSTDNKMALVVRTDLPMTKGKAAVQCAHAAILCYKKASKETPRMLKQWETFGQAKVTLKVDGEEPLRRLEAKARDLGIVTAVVRDAGRTQVEAESVTVLGVGPAPAKIVDQVTGHLKLY